MSESDWSTTDIDTTTTAACDGEINAHLIRLFSDDTRCARCTRRKIRHKDNTDLRFARPDNDASSTATKVTLCVARRALIGSSKHSCSESKSDPAIATQSKQPLKSSLHDALFAALDIDADKDAAPTAANSLNEVVVRIIECIRKGPDKAETAGALLRSLRDPLNTQLRHDVRHGTVTPEALVSMDDESLLNPQLRDQQRAARLARLEQSTVEYWQQMNSTLTTLFTCPACNGHECYANFRSTDFVKWQGDDPTPTLLTCKHCRHSFRA